VRSGLACLAAGRAAAVLAADAGREPAAPPFRQTRAVRTIWSFSLSGVSLTQVFGSVRYLACDSTSSGSRLFSMTGLVVSQVSSPGGSTYSQTSEWLKGSPMAMSRTI
jgi:hypothetical protein